ncbi:bumetanide-sensitive sodium-(potassium)-chloride cotransporter [Ischnura elegans]|uniref:bumetanide-sensitive sodium-(potassium)-chloride cotransporter n=1 Tax=Ischnura elegans TaxID=197161 RepID=UPI001ED87B91|nr:bumetanide-sensitive sodium-(potassium)-chloride cotransporter [Ischnura elegans]
MAPETRFTVRRVSRDAAQVAMPGVPEHATLEMVSTVQPAQGYEYNPGMRPSSQLTIEALPRLDNYRNMASVQAAHRPSLGELHGEEKRVEDEEDIKDKDPTKGAGHGAGGHGIKLGWIQGVLIPCLLNIWGVMLFLRLSWVVGQAGIVHSLIIIGISAIVCVLTTLSLSAISTNGEVKGGGIYYIISRSLGPEFGASVGIVFAFANAVAASMNTIGFCDSLNNLLRENGLQIIDGGVNDVRVVGVVAIFIMVIICAVGMEWESKAQNLLVVIIVGAIIDFIGGAIRGPPSDLEKAQGFPGLSGEVFKANVWSDYRYSENVNQDFFSVFAIFFPSVTGIQAGANISGDLKDPADAIPKGTLLSLLISMISYAVFVLLAGGGALRDASGSVEDLVNGTMSSCVAAHNCTYGLQNNYSVMQLMSLWGPFIYAGCFAATLSTALTNLLSVPRLIQALGIDRIYPGLIFFSKGYGKAGEPYRGYALTFVISAAFLLIAQLNIIAPLISNFYLASYALINFCTFHAALVKPVGWRPTFKYYNMWLSLIGFILCVGIMFLINWVASIITLLIIFALYLIVVYRKPDVNWGSSTQAQTYKNALTSTLRLSSIGDHVKNYRPQVLLLIGQPAERPPLLDLFNLITKNLSLLICADLSHERLSHRGKGARQRRAAEWLKQHKVKAFYSIVDGMGFEEGAQALIQASGVGKLRPNVLAMGYKSTWQTCQRSELIGYFNTLHDAFDNRLGVAILRVDTGLDYSRVTTSHHHHHEDGLSLALPSASSSAPDLRAQHSPLGGRSSPLVGHRDAEVDNGRTEGRFRPKLAHLDSMGSIDTLDRYDSDSSLHTSGSLGTPTSHDSSKDKKPTDAGNPHDIIKSKTKAMAKKMLPLEQNIPPEILDEMTQFQRKQKNGTVDVWWLYDDGGLTLLLPYILTTRHNWSECNLRIFALANSRLELEVEERNMAILLSKFRIDYSSLKMVYTVGETPKKETAQFFESLLQGFKEGDSNASPKCMVTDSELTALQSKTNRQLRLRELLQENSSKANLIVMSLPMPRRGVVSAPLYMAWLETLTRGMPPFLLVRGNQQSVLTFYS